MRDTVYGPLHVQRKAENNAKRPPKTEAEQLEIWRDMEDDADLRGMWASYLICLGFGIASIMGIVTVISWFV